MTRNGLQPPAFIRDADLDGLHPQEVEQALDGMVARLEPTPPSAPVRARLLGQVREPPWRYGPFFHRVAELFDLPADRVQALLGRLADPAVFRPAGLPGVREVRVEGGPRVQGAQTSIVRFAPGTRLPRHHHRGSESVLVLEGSYIEDDGPEYGPGDLHEMAEGTTHGFRVTKGGPCIAGVVLHGGLHFEAWPLRLLARVLGRD
jgi:quercetin dioxygenase-like cupin family protein